MTILGVATASLFHRRIRTIITQLSMIVAVVVVTISISSVSRIQKMIDGSNNPRLYTMSPLPSASLPFSYVARLQSFPGVSGTVEYQRSYGSTRTIPNDPTRYSVWATSDGFPVTYSPHIFVLEPEVQRAWVADRQGLLVAADLAARLGWKEGQSVVVPARFDDVSARVTGILPGHGEMVILHYDYIEQAPKNDKRGVVSRIVTPCPRDQFGTMARAIDTAFVSSTDPTLTIPEYSFHERFLSSIAAVPQLLAKMGWLVAFVTTLITASTLMMSVRERRGEFGTLRALGFTRARVFGLILFESLVLCVPAGLVGAGVPYLLFHDKGLNLGPTLESVPVTSIACVIAIAGAALLGFLVSVLPALNAARTNVIEALQK